MKSKLPINALVCPAILFAFALAFFDTNFSIAIAQGTVGKLVTTFTNPTPAASDFFGTAVAAVGTDRVLIGASQDDTGATNAGAAYLFSIDGALLTTFTNPTPAAGDLFGTSVAAVGNDRVLIGAHQDDTDTNNAGAAYLFSTNGVLLTTFTKPTPANNDFFGFSVAAVGSDRVLIGAYGDDTDFGASGAAYLFSVNGALLTTFTNPTPALGDRFGSSVAAAGSERVLIGANGDNTGASDAGAAYLFSTNGTLLTTFTNPTPAFRDLFGDSLSAVGSDRVLIGADEDDTGAEDAGTAYLFSTNGTLLTTFTNPTPAQFQFFASSLATVGTDRVLIGAYQNEPGRTAYLFSTYGTLLNTFTNPTPALNDFFGFSVTAVGNDRVLIGANRANTHADDAGAAYLFRFDETFLKVVGTNGVMTVFWERPAMDFVLDETMTLVGSPTTPWMQVPFPYQTNATHIYITVPMPTTNKFYRLRK